MFARFARRQWRPAWAFLIATTLVTSTEKPARAILTYYIFQDGANVVIRTRGSLNLPAPTGTNNCGAAGFYSSSFATICTGPSATVNSYALVTNSGPTDFASIATNFSSSATSTSGLTTLLQGGLNYFAIGPAYSNSSQITSEAIFQNKTLSQFGYASSSNVVATWTVFGTGDTIRLFVGEPPPVPAPIPILGAGVAWKLSRRLRHRIASGQSLM